MLFTGGRYIIVLCVYCLDWSLQPIVVGKWISWPRGNEQQTTPPIHHDFIQEPRKKVNESSTAAEVVEPEDTFSILHPYIDRLVCHSIPAYQTRAICKSVMAKRILLASCKYDNDKKSNKIVRHA
jgi:hypothetical protein